MKRAFISLIVFLICLTNFTVLNRGICLKSIITNTGEGISEMFQEDGEKQESNSSAIFYFGDPSVRL